MRIIPSIICMASICACSKAPSTDSYAQNGFLEPKPSFSPSFQKNSFIKSKNKTGTLQKRGNPPFADTDDHFIVAPSIDPTRVDFTRGKLFYYQTLVGPPMPVEVSEGVINGPNFKPRK
jgi:hypothetical protein